MGEIVELFRNNAKLRSLITWNNIFSQLIINKSLIESELKKNSKDNLLKE
jgi:hypothetical protein